MQSQICTPTEKLSLDSKCYVTVLEIKIQDKMKKNFMHDTG